MREDPMCGIMQARSPLGNLLISFAKLVKRSGLVRDQGVGGSNPLSPTNLFEIQSVKSQSVGVPSSHPCKNARMGQPLLW